MGEIVGNTLKLISGFILFVVGVLIVYEVNVYNLIDILLVVGFLIAIVGIIMIISYFVDANADKTSSIVKEFLESNSFKSPSFNKESKTNEGPLKIRNTFDNYYEDDLSEYGEDYYESSSSEFFDFDQEENPKAVLRVTNDQSTTNFGDNLSFTPNYDKPLKITRKPKKRSHSYFTPKTGHDKSEEIKRALHQEEEYIKNETYKAPKPKEVTEPRDIKIDINHPESLPVPKLLRSFVVYEGGLITSSEAFDKLAADVNKEIMLEIPSLNELSDRFLSHVPTIYSRVIINDFDVSDMPYMILVASLLKQGVEIKTVPQAHSTNLIVDDAHAMIISKSGNDVEYGAIYEDRKSISEIRTSFEKTWDIATDLDENLVANYIK